MKNNTRVPTTTMISQEADCAVAKALLHLKDTSPLVSTSEWHHPSWDAQSLEQRTSKKQQQQQRMNCVRERSRSVVTDDESSDRENHSSSPIAGSRLTRMALKMPPKLVQVTRKKSSCNRMPKIKTLPLGRPLRAPPCFPAHEGRCGKIQPIRMQLP